MTVLSKYQRLECDGVWTASAGAQRRDVVVCLGDATLVIKDTADNALTHWSLPAVEQVGAGSAPALFRPGTDDDETLEIADETMIDAIRTVQKALIRTKPHPGRLRRAVLAVSAAAVLALGIWWLPEALVRHTAGVLPDTVRGEIGQRVLRALGPYAGQTCTRAPGVAALKRLQDRVLSEPGWSVVVVSGGPRSSAHLPGRLILVRRDLIDNARGPAPLAGAMLIEALRAEAEDPMLDLLRMVGPGATLGLLTSGTLGRQDLETVASQALVGPRGPLPDDLVVARFAAAKVPLGPYLAVAQPAEASLDPGEDVARGTDLLDDAGWQRLRAICGE